MLFMVDLRIDIRTKDMLNITLVRSAALYNVFAISYGLLASNSKLPRAEIAY